MTGNADDQRARISRAATVSIAPGEAAALVAERQSQLLHF
jgi:hypothetical protein